MACLCMSDDNILPIEENTQHTCRVLLLEIVSSMRLKPFLNIKLNK